MLKEIQNRRSIRNYKSENVSKEKIIDILKSGIQAPSAKNNQPWRFVIVNEEIKNKISNKMVELYGPNKTAEVIKTVPYLILIYNWCLYGKYDIRSREYWIRYFMDRLYKKNRRLCKRIS